jgi:hypothetical protein
MLSIGCPSAKSFCSGRGDSLTGPRRQDDEGESSDRQRLVRESADATSEYWWAFREEGHFGSHPQHDDYGDEGDP